MTSIRSVLLFAFFALTSGAPAFAQPNLGDPDLVRMLRTAGHFDAAPPTKIRRMLTHSI